MYIVNVYYVAIIYINSKFKQNGYKYNNCVLKITVD